MRKSKSPYVHQASLMYVGTFFKEAVEDSVEILIRLYSFSIILYFRVNVIFESKYALCFG